VILQNPGSYPARMEFRLYRSADGWKVFDVLAQGRSVLMYYRGQMMRQLRMGQANR
jgi:phospholipid transport system substrate-binding protein